MRHFPSRRFRRFIFPALLSTVFALAAGCGGPGPKVSRISRIQAIEIEPGDGKTEILLLSDRAFDPQLKAASEPPRLEIRIPFALYRDIGSLDKKLKLPLGGIKSLKVSNLRGKFGGVSIDIQTEREFEFKSSKRSKSFVVEILYKDLPSRVSDESKEGEPRGKSRAAKKRPDSKLEKAKFVVPLVTSTQREGNYTVGGKDVLSILVFEEPDLTKRDMRVSNDGFITFPLIGRLRVGGLTLNQIEKALVSRLGKDFLVNPQITVQVVEFSSKFINVLGAVKGPGGIPLKGPITLLETIAKAGGVNVSEAGKNIIVLRHSGDKKKDVKHITVNLNRLLKEGDLSLNLALRDKDTVFIPEADQIFVFGEVNNPGPYDLTEENFSVVEAISKAGGLTKLAAANRTRIVRVEGGEEFAIEVDVEKIMEGDRSQDQFLKPGDIIVIPEVYF